MGSDRHASAASVQRLTMQAAPARGVLGGTSRMGCLLRWKAGETRSPPRYVPASNCGAEDVMARTRAPWTSQNAPPRMQSQRALLAERVQLLARLQRRT